MPYHQAPAEYTGEQFGVQYLYKQSLPINCDDVAIDEEDEVDEGLGDESLIFPPLSISEDFSTFSSVVENTEVYFTDVFDEGLFNYLLSLGFLR